MEPHDHVSFLVIIQFNGVFKLKNVPITPIELYIIQFIDHSPRLGRAHSPVHHKYITGGLAPFEGRSEGRILFWFRTGAIECINTGEVIGARSCRNQYGVQSTVTHFPIGYNGKILAFSYQTKGLVTFSTQFIPKLQKRIRIRTRIYITRFKNEFTRLCFIHRESTEVNLVGQNVTQHMTEWWKFYQIDK